MNSTSALRLAQEFLDSPNLSQNVDEAGLLALLLLLFDSIRQFERRHELAQLVIIASREKAVTQWVHMIIGHVHQEIRRYFTMYETGFYPGDFDYCQPAQVQHPLATLILWFSCVTAVHIYKDELKIQDNETYVLEAYRHPITNAFGVWMSVKAIRFAPDRLRD